MNEQNPYHEAIAVINTHFDRCLKKKSIGHQKVSWGSVQSQQERFEILAGIGELNYCTVLDVGCGLGAMYNYLSQTRNMKLSGYVGVDLNPNMVAEASKIFPGTRFEVSNLLVNPPESTFDYVFASGIFNIVTPNISKIIHGNIKAMFDLCRFGVAVNFFSTLSPFDKDPNSYYSDPGHLLAFVCKNISRKVVLRHDYRKNDFTLYIYREQP